MYCSHWYCSSSWFDYRMRKIVINTVVNTAKTQQCERNVCKFEHTIIWRIINTVCESLSINIIYVGMFNSTLHCILPSGLGGILII